MSDNAHEEPKKPYETPNLTKVGKVTEVTQGHATPVTDGALIGSQ